MKPKYEKMIDEYVKKHYGDLERGVLAPEVKYKVLFKIYRKKYKKEKVIADNFGRIFSDSNSCYGCEHYVPMHPDEGLTIIPASCKLGKSMSACCPFYSVKVDEDKESSYLDWLHDDITWCCRECGDTGCERNSRNRRCKEGLYSVADMFDPFKCPVDAEMPKEQKK